MVKQRCAKGSRRFPRTRSSRRLRQKYHRAWIELLEPRLALSAPQFLLLPDSLTLLSGTSLNVALSGTDAGNQPGGIPAFYDFQLVGVSNVNLTNPHVQNPQLIAEVLDPLSNRSMKITVKDPQDQIDGSMTIQLFEQLAPKTTQRIIDLANGTGNPPTGPTGGGPFYDGLTFHRVIKDFMIQGGDPAGDGSGGSGVKFDDEFNSQLQFTSSGILALAKPADDAQNAIPDTNDSQFFITAEPTRWLDFTYTIFGFLTRGNDILQKIESVPTGAGNKPVHDVVMQWADIFVDGEDRTLRLFVPDGTTGTADVTVSISGDPHWDGTGDPPAPVLHTFHVTVAADTNNNSPFLGPIPTIVTTANAVKSGIQIPATDVEGDAIYYDGGVVPANTNLAFTVDHNSGLATLTAGNNWAGVGSVMVGVQTPSGQSWDTQAVPVYVNPAKPTVTLLASSDTGPSTLDGITNPNLTQDHTLGFSISGLTNGAQAVLYADGTEIARGTASSSFLVLRSATTFTWTEGSHSITAKQTLLNQAVDVGNTHTTVDLASDPSDPLGITVDTATPQITSTAVETAQRGHPYAYHVESNEDPNVQYELTRSPGGMQIDLRTGQIVWTPAASETAEVPVIVRITDLAGNTADQSFQITVQNVNNPPVATPQESRVVSDTPKAIRLTGDDGNSGVVQALTYAIASQPGHGTLSPLNPAEGDVTYTPTAGYAGDDSFTFTVTDDDTAGPPGPLTSAPAAVLIQVVPVNHSPTANPQSATTDENAAITITLSGDDGDPNLQQTLSFLIVDRPSHGTVSVLSANAGTVRYTPQAGYNGPDSFTFRTMDDDTAEPPFMTSGPATVSITVNRVNSPPTATPQNLTLDQNTSQAIVLTGNGNDPEVTQVLTFAIPSGPSHGTLGGFDPATGAVTYTPAADYSGADSFTFTVTDDAQAGDPANLTSQTVLVALNVHAVNAPPTATPQSVTTAENSSLALAFAGDDGDPEVQQTLRFNLVQGPSHGTLSGFDPATGHVTYVPSPYYNGSDSFTFTVTDDGMAGNPPNLTSPPATASIEVTPVDYAPQFAPVSRVSAVPGQTVQTSVKAVDLDNPGGALVYSLDPGAPQGATINSQTGVLTFNVPQQFPPGTVRVTVRATKATDPSLSATQTVDFSVVNLSLFLSPGALLAARTEIAPSLVTPPALSDLPAAAPASPILGLQLGFGPSDLLSSQAFFSDPFGPPPNGSGVLQPPTPPTKAGQEGSQGQKKAAEGDASGKNPSQQGTGDSSENDEKKDKARQQRQTGVASPELNDAAIQEYMEGEDGRELAAADADLLAATAQ